MTRKKKTLAELIISSTKNYRICQVLSTGAVEANHWVLQLYQMTTERDALNLWREARTCYPPNRCKYVVIEIIADRLESIILIVA